MAELGERGPHPALEKAIQGGVKPFFKYMERRTRSGKLKEAVADIDAGRTPQNDPVKEKEMLAHGAANLRKIWDAFEASGATADGSLVMPESDLVEAVQAKKGDALPVSLDTFSPKGLRKLFESSAYMAFSHIGAYNEARENEVRDAVGFPLSEDASLYERYKENLAYLSLADVQSNRSNPTSHLRAGMGTALQINWGVFNAIPAAFKRKLNREITAEEFESLMPQASKFIHFLATTHLKSILALLRELGDPEIWKTDEPPFFKHLCLKEEKGRFVFDIEPEGLMKIAHVLDRGTPIVGFKYGCLAIQAKGKSNTNVVAEVTTWVGKSVKKYMLEHMNDYARWSTSVDERRK